MYIIADVKREEALDNITLSVEKANFSIVGGNGSGKSTLIQHFNGLLYPQSGSISVLGIDPRDRQKGKSYGGPWAWYFNSRTADF